MDNNKKDNTNGDDKNKQENPKRLLIPFSASPEEALEAFKKYFNIKIEDDEEKDQKKPKQSN